LEKGGYTLFDIMFKYFSRFACVVLACGIAVSSVCAQINELTSVDDDFENPLSNRKKPNIFRRPRKDTPAEQLAYADSLAKAGIVRKATKQYRALVHKWHESSEAPTAQMRFAQLLEKRGHHKKAFTEYQYLIDNFPGRFAYGEALDRQFRIANLIMMSRRWKLFFLPGFAMSEDSIPLFRKIVINAPQWERVPEIQFLIATIHEEAGDDDKAVAAYRKLTQNYPDSSYADDAAFQIGMCLHEQTMDRPRNEKALRDAISAFSDFLRSHPESNKRPAVQEKLKELNRTLAGLYYERAVFYDKMAKKPEAAYIAYVDFVRKFPSSELAADATTRAETIKKELEDNDQSEK
jgi:outer membrane assembly lipoprotein YfiO